jgi:hypothetical protein
MTLLVQSTTRVRSPSPKNDLVVGVCFIPLHLLVRVLHCDGLIYKLFTDVTVSKELRKKRRFLQTVFD